MYDGERADLFYCGPEEEPAVSRVEKLIHQVGLRPVRVGDLNQVSVLDALTRLWFSLAVAQVRDGTWRSKCCNDCITQH